VSTATSDADILEAMKDVVDPEHGINVVDLGLV
jgi:metal-sulfur cluster biosynthetic enzyme